MSMEAPRYLKLSSTLLVTSAAQFADGISIVRGHGELTAIRLTAPWLGQHSEEIVRGLGYADKEVARMFESGVIFDADREPR